MCNYQRDLENKGARIEKKTRDDFVLSDWALNPLTREWNYCRDGIKLILDKNEATNSGVLKDRLISQALTAFMPLESTVVENL